MKEIISYSTNTLALVSGGKLLPQAEIILALCEPSYRLTSDGDLARERIIETVRFCCAPATLRRISEKFLKTAEDIEAEVEAAKTASEKKSP